MVVLQHVLVGLHVEVWIVLCMFSEADRAILVDNASDFGDVANA